MGEKWYAMCKRDDKMRYRDKSTAMQVARRVRKKTGEGIFPYYCERHESWHIGHHPDRAFLRNMGRKGKRGYQDKAHYAS